MTFDPKILAKVARCFCFLPGREVSAFKIYLLCQWANVPSGPVACTSTVVDNWVSRVSAAGGTAVTSAIYDALCQFCNGLVTDGIFNKMIAVNCVVPGATSPATTPGELTRALIPLIRNEGNNVWTNNNFVAGDLTIDGLKGNGSSKFLQTGIIPSASAYLSDTTGGVTVYSVTSASENKYEYGGWSGVGINQVLFQFRNAVGSFLCDCWGSGAGRITAANLISAGFVSENRIAGPSHAAYVASSTQAFVQLVSNGTTNGSVANITKEMYFYNWNNNGGPGVGTYSSRRNSFLAVHQGLTQSECQKFYNRIVTMRTALGGGLV